ncbi:MAG: AmmeMemoRadiSam system protein B [Acidobacteria bacterium]|nr:AmmeMemoRadiSam system protein B [Acidobacteriota bacterium]
MRKITVFVAAILLASSVYIPTAACRDPEFSGTRPPAVAGQFYPSDPGILQQVVRQFIGESSAIPMEDPVAILVPHAGYIYSGQISADAYRQLMNRDYDVFVILGVNHTSGGFRGISLAGYESYQTPLGKVPIDKAIAKALLAQCSDCVQNREVHIREHSIEVQIPFIQVLFPEAKIVPVIIHSPDPEFCTRFGRTLAGVLKDKKALIVISSDLSHYPDYEDAVLSDKETLLTIAGRKPDKIVSVMRDLDVPNLGTRACGEAAILAGVAAAGTLGANRTVVAGYSNSGEIAVGDRSRVVGYGALALAPGDAPDDTGILNRPAPPDSATPLNESEKKILLTFARKTIRQYLTTQTVPLARNFPSRLNFRQGAFVTLKKEGYLRGCIGNILPEEELGRTVGRVAWQAAMKDPRFRPVELEELKDLEIEISVLTPMKPVTDPDGIVVGRDGVLLYKEGRSAVFLPQVAPENDWNRTEMLDNLCLKAGLPAGCWEENATFRTFQADVFSVMN